MTKYESVLAQELTAEERELLAVQVTTGLEPDYGWMERDTFVAELERRMRHADAHPETLVEWDEAEREIFGELSDE